MRWWLGGIVGLVAAGLVAAASAALPPEAIEALRRDAVYHVRLRIEALDKAGGRGRVRPGDCVLHGTVLAVMRGDGALAVGDGVAAAVDCWPHDRIKYAPFGSNHFPYGDRRLPGKEVEAWLGGGAGTLRVWDWQWPDER